MIFSQENAILVCMMFGEGVHLWMWMNAHECILSKCDTYARQKHRCSREKYLMWIRDIRDNRSHSPVVCSMYIEFRLVRNRKSRYWEHVNGNVSKNLNPLPFLSLALCDTRTAETRNWTACNEKYSEKMCITYDYYDFISIKSLLLFLVGVTAEHARNSKSSTIPHI